MNNILNLGKDLYIKGRIGWKGLKKEEYLDSGNYKIINATALEDGYIDWSNCGYISKERYEESPEIMLQENDILISKDGTLGKIGYVKNIKAPCSVASGIFVIRNTAKEKVNFDYLYYLLTSHIFKDFINRNKASGSTINHLYQRDLEQFEINLPSIEKQERIAFVLNSIDSKIQNNKKQIETLESLAKTIYDYWFIQFDFPNEEGKPYKSSGGKMVWNEELKREIPEGWTCIKLFDIFSFIKGKIPQELLEKKEPTLEQYITIDVANGGMPQYCSPDLMPYCNSETIMVMDGAASGDVYVGIDGVLGSTFSMLKSKREDISNPYIYLMLNSLKKIYKKANTGSTVPHANRKYIENMVIALPSDCKFYSRKIDEIFAQIKLQKMLIKELNSLRVFLLPMLMNGQVSLN